MPKNAPVWDWLGLDMVVSLGLETAMRFKSSKLNDALAPA